MKLAMFQMENAGSIQKNLEKSLNAIKRAASEGADMILFPEVQLTEFFPQYPGKECSFIGGLSLRYFFIYFLHTKNPITAPTIKPNKTFNISNNNSIITSISIVH